jgi:hypothetical protein
MRATCSSIRPARRKCRYKLQSSRSQGAIRSAIRKCFCRVEMHEVEGIYHMKSGRRKISSPSIVEELGRSALQREHVAFLFAVSLSR